MTEGTLPVDVERAIVRVRGEAVLLDEDLARLYGVETKALGKAVSRNPRRFPEPDFVFRLTTEEYREILRYQIGTSSSGAHGGRRYPPRAFTREGVAMFSSVLQSERAIEVNIAIMRAFAHMQRLAIMTGGLPMDGAEAVGGILRRQWTSSISENSA